ncbi:ABC transporter substrate-binding protein [Acerihabitans arboris]|uniref:Glycine/betaine ABC transporter substrate-binding protein n=1 Tax=Acerihabitans arboris TaxID=2691583 RepID=A0A845SGX6_9GAMM|nr:ABC transporter substrate-binding protein [Acerihabitans arboris]NDL64120.1 glycine/betaine ABC transporter substrate-binding protein [Acerihabitans arboris]
MKMNQLLAATLFSTVLLHAALASADDKATATGDVGTIIVGSADFPESQLLATIYADALAAKNIKVEKKLNIGSREVYMPALLDGSINLIPEYSGATLSYLDEKTQAHSAEDVEAALAKALPAKIKMLSISPAQDSDVLAVTAKTAKQHNLKTIGDLQPVAGKLVLGGPAEWKSRREGVKGLQEVYGLTFKNFRVLDVAGPLTLSALVNNQIQVADMTSTDPAMKKNNLVALEDPKHLFPAQNIVPLIAADKLSAPIEETLNKISAQLTTDDLIVMNGKLANFDSIDAVSKEWLSRHGLDK